MGKLLVRLWRVFCSSGRSSAPIGGKLIKKPEEEPKEEDQQPVIFDLPENELMDKPTGTVAVPGNEQR